jgi:DNA-binding XRE family transcriptional regulator
MTVQIIEKNGKPEWAVLPYDEYRRLLAHVEMLQDVHDYDQAKLDLANDAELIPSEVAYALLDGANPLKVWREHLGLTQQQVAEAAGISKPYLSQLESGRRQGTTQVLQAIAKALNISLDDLVPSKENE